MPIENERKFVLNLDNHLNVISHIEALHECKHTRIHQIYLPGGIRARALKDKDNHTKFIFGYKKKINGKILEIETEISPNDFNSLYSIKKSFLLKNRLSWITDEYTWDLDLFIHNEKPYFFMLEIEMPETINIIPKLPNIINDNMLYHVSEHDNNFSSKKLCSVKHAQKTLTSLMKG